MLDFIGGNSTMPIQTLQDYHNLIKKCRSKTLKKGERYVALELVLEMILQCGVTAQEIPYIWIQDVTDKKGNVQDSFPSYLYVDQIDITPIKREVEVYLNQLRQWNQQSNRNDPRLFPKIPRRQAIERSIERLDPTISISDIQDFAKQNGYPIRRTRLMKKRKATYDSCCYRLFQIAGMKNRNVQKNRAKLLLRKIRHIRKVEDLEVWEGLEKNVQVLV